MPRKKIVVSSNLNRPREIFELCNHHEALNKAMATLRAKHQIDVVEMRKKDKVSQLKFLKVFGDKELQKDVRKMLKGLKISEGNFWYVYQYVIDGNVGNMGEIEKDPEGLVVEYDQKNKDDVVFRVGPRTTKTDLDEAWNAVLRWRHDGKSPRRKKKTEQDRDYEIFVWAYIGKCTINEIYRMVLWRYEQDLDFGDIKKIVSNMYTKYKIPPDKRPILKTEEGSFVNLI